MNCVEFLSGHSHFSVEAYENKTSLLRLVQLPASDCLSGGMRQDFRTNLGNKKGDQVNT